jgi:hypothetical protein
MREQGHTRVFEQGVEDILSMYRAERLPGDRKHVLLACFPKSGSTYLARLIANAGGYSHMHLSDSAKGGEHELSAARLLLHHQADYVTQLHLRCSLGTALLIEKFSLLPVVLYRDIFDTVVSMKDDLKNDTVEYPAFASPFPIAYIPNNVRLLADDELLSFVIDMLVPWYLGFYGSWYRYPGRKICLSYRELIEETPRVLREISDAFQLGWSDSAVAKAIGSAENEDTRKNQAVAGRGRLLGAHQRQRIVQLCRYFDGVDFSPIGASPA